MERDLPAYIKIKHASRKSKIIMRVSDRSTDWSLLVDASQYGFVTGLFDKG